MHGPKKLTDLVVLQGTSFCNLNCDYCYVPDRKINQVMPQSILEKAAKLLLSSDLLKNDVTFLWHSGEPLALGIDYYEKSIRLIEKLNVKNKKINYCVQTNATLINDKWCDFFIKNHFKVGVSIDGPKFLHDIHRVTWNNKGSFDKVIKGINFLKKHNLPLAAIAVITSESLNHPDEFFNFFYKQGFERLSLVTEDITGENKATSFQTSASNMKINSARDPLTTPEQAKANYRAFIKKLFELWLPVKNELYIREFSEMSRNIYKAKNSSKFTAISQEMIPFNIITITNKGDISTYCPELASGTEKNISEFSISNIMAITNLKEILESKKFIKIKQAIDKGTKNCQSTCKYFRLCGGRSPSNKFYENGSFESTLTNYCELQIQQTADVILDYIKTSQTAYEKKQNKA